MSRRTINIDIAQNVISAMMDAGMTAESVSRATDIPVAELNDALEGRTSFMARQLWDLGGLFGRSADSFLEGVA
jgi:hypothetical protein